MSEKGLFSPLERLGHGLWDIAVGLGAVALGIHFFKKSVKSSKESAENN